MMPMSVRDLNRVFCQKRRVGIAASGRTPYTVGAVLHARALGAFTIAVRAADSPITRAAEVSVVPVVGPEVVTGSTRLKAGTAQNGTEHDLNSHDGRLAMSQAIISNVQPRNKNSASEASNHHD